MGICFYALAKDIVVWVWCNNSQACESEIQTTTDSLKENSRPSRATLWGL
jgi:hypothetical protein